VLVAPTLGKTRKQQTSNEGGWVLWSGWGPGAPQQHRQPLADPPSPNSTDTKISAFSNVTSISSKSSTVRTLDSRTSWAPRRNNTKTSAPFSKETPYHAFGSGWHLYNNHTIESLKDLGLDSQRVRNLLPSFMFILSITLPNLFIIPDVLSSTSINSVNSVNFAAKLVHTRRALSSTIINSHQEPVSDQACNPPDPQWYFLFGGGVLRYPVPKWLLFLH